MKIKLEYLSTIFNLSEKEIEYLTSINRCNIKKETIDLKRGIDIIDSETLYLYKMSGLKCREKIDKLKEFGKLLKNMYAVPTNPPYTEFIIHAGPTNSGKTYAATQELLKANTGAYLAPLRLLAAENYHTIKGKKGSCNLLTGQERIDENAGITSSTVEMVNLSTKYDVVVIDECFMISDANRGGAWSNAILGVNAKQVHLITSDYNLDTLCEFLSYFNRKFSVKNYTRLVPLEYMTKKRSVGNAPPKTVFIVFSKNKVFSTKLELNKMGKSTSIIYGSMPPEVKKQQMELFNSGKTSYCVSTDAIGMGLNLPCDNIVFLDIKKFDGQVFRQITGTEASQIAGRAGRYGKSECGRVYGLEHIINSAKNPPKSKQIYFNYNFDLFTHLSFFDTFKKQFYIYSEMFTYYVGYGKVVSRQSYMEILQNIKNIHLIPYDKAIGLLKIPMGQQTYGLLSRVCNYIRKNKAIDYDFLSLNDIEIKYSSDMLRAEQQIMEIDTLLYLYNYDIITINPNYLDELRDERDEIIETINDFLHKAILDDYKSCNNCGQLLHLTFSHNMCEDCYYNNF